MLKRIMAVGGVLAAVAGGALADEALWQKLQNEDNMIVLIRHGDAKRADEGGGPVVWDPSGHCKGENTLTELGKQQAAEIAEAFKSRGIRPTVVSSPMCRCRDTAQIAAGPPLTDPVLRQVSPSDSGAREAFMEKSAELFRTHRGKSPILFVNHQPNIDSLTMELVTQGELLVGQISDSGEVDVLGRILMPQ